MKSSATKSNSTSDSQSYNHFFNNSKKRTFFSQNKEANTPFFSPSTIQPKLSIGQPNDKYEQEADAMSDQVVNHSAPHSIQTKCEACEEEEKVQKSEEEHNEGAIMSKKISESNDDMPDDMVQSKCEACNKKAPIENSDEEKLQLKEVEEDEDTHDRNVASSIEPRLNSSKGGGSFLPDNTRMDMESAFDSDFSGVKIHTGHQAVQMNQELGAKAFTHGKDIYFNQGQY